MDDTHQAMLTAMAKALDTDMSKLVRRWIREHWEDKYREYLLESEKS